MIEVELKFAIPPDIRVPLQQQLAAAPSMRWLAQNNNSDIYYDTAHFDCFQQAVFIRIRNHARLEIKFHDSDDPDHTHSTERVFPLRSDPSLIKEMNMLCSRFLPGWREAPSIEEAIRGNDLREFARIANHRTQYAHKNLILCLDDVAGLGNFLEIEATCQQDSDIEPTLAKLHSFVSDLAFPALQPVQTGYVELWLRLHHPQIFQLRKVTV